MNLASKTLLAIPILSMQLLAQVTHIVGVGGFPEIGDALAVAQAADTILVQPGVYLPFTASVGVRIIAPSGATVRSPLQAGPWVSTVVQVPPGQAAYVRGLDFQQPDSLHPHMVRVVGGQVAFDHCTFSPTHPFKSFYTLICVGGDLVLTSCTFSTFNGAVSVSGGSFVATDCAFYGVDPQGTQPSMPAAVSISNSTAELSFCTLTGGSSSAIGQPACPAMVVGGNSAVSLVSCLVTGGNVNQGSGPASTGLINNGSQPVRHLGSSFVGGSSRMFTNWGSWPIRGPGVTGPEQASALLGLAPLVYGLNVGQSYGFAAVGTPSTPIVYGVNFGLIAPLAVPSVAQPIRLDPATTLYLGLGVTTAQGFDSRTVSNSLPAAAVGTPLWIQGFAWDGTQFQASPPIGGLLR